MQNLSDYGKHKMIVAALATADTFGVRQFWQQLAMWPRVSESNQASIFAVQVPGKGARYLALTTFNVCLFRDSGALCCKGVKLEHSCNYLELTEVDRTTTPDGDEITISGRGFTQTRLQTSSGAVIMDSVMRQYAAYAPFAFPTTTVLPNVPATYEMLDPRQQEEARMYRMAVACIMQGEGVGALRALQTLLSALAPPSGESTLPRPRWIFPPKLKDATVKMFLTCSAVPNVHCGDEKGSILAQVRLAASVPTVTGIVVVGYRGKSLHEELFQALNGTDHNVSTLFISGSPLQDQGCSLLFSPTTRAFPRGLRHLIIDRGGLCSDQSLVTLGAFLVAHPVIEGLCLDGNSFKSLDALAEGLRIARDNNVLRSVSVAHCGAVLTDTFAEAVSRTTKNRDVVVDIVGNRFEGRPATLASLVPLSVSRDIVPTRELAAAFMNCCVLNPPPPPCLVRLGGKSAADRPTPEAMMDMLESVTAAQPATRPLHVDFTAVAFADRQTLSKMFHIVMRCSHRCIETVDASGLLDDEDFYKMLACDTVRRLVANGKERPLRRVNAMAWTALAENKTLTSLDIRDNQLGDDAISALGQALRQNRTLTELYLDGNDATEVGLQAIRGCLYGNKKLATMPLPSQDIAKRVAAIQAAKAAAYQDEMKHRAQMKKYYKRKTYNYRLAREYCDKMVVSKVQGKGLVQLLARFNLLQNEVEREVEHNAKAAAAKMRAADARRAQREAERQASKEAARQARAEERERLKLQRAAENAARKERLAAAKEQKRLQTKESAGTGKVKKEAKPAKLPPGMLREPRPLSKKAVRMNAKREKALAAIQRHRGEVLGSLFSDGFFSSRKRSLEEMVGRFENMYAALHKQYCSILLDRVEDAGPIPQEWVQLSDATGAPYFFNQQTYAATYEDPRMLRVPIGDEPLGTAMFDPLLFTNPDDQLHVYCYNLYTALYFDVCFAPLPAGDKVFPRTYPYLPNVVGPKRSVYAALTWYAPSATEVVTAAAFYSTNRLTQAFYDTIHNRPFAIAPPPAPQKSPPKTKFWISQGQTTSDHTNAFLWNQMMMDDGWGDCDDYCHHHHHGDDHHHHHGDDHHHHHGDDHHHHHDHPDHHHCPHDPTDAFAQLDQLNIAFDTIGGAVVDDIAGCIADVFDSGALDIDMYGAADLLWDSSEDEEPPNTACPSVDAPAARAYTATLRGSYSERRTPTVARQPCNARNVVATSKHHDRQHVERLTVDAYCDEGVFPVPSRRVWRCSRAFSSPPPTGGLTVVTQCSMDRLARLFALAASVAHDPVHSACTHLSAAILLRAEDGLDHALLAVEDAWSEMRRSSGTLATVVVSFVLERPDDDYYPINTLRNVALDASPTDTVFLVDVDFTASHGLLCALHGLTDEHVTVGSKTALVVPAFETADESLPATMKALAVTIDNGTAESFHASSFPRGHAPTDVPRWLSTRDPYEVAYADGYEPYVVVSRTAVPRYDERFVGYGLNKVQHLWHMAQQGFRFVVVPEAFVVCKEHPRSAQWQRTFGLQRDPLQRLRVQGLYQRFQREVREHQQALAASSC